LRRDGVRRSCHRFYACSRLKAVNVVDS
jgi:hypothetical protein